MAIDDKSDLERKIERISLDKLQSLIASPTELHGYISGLHDLISRLQDEAKTDGLTNIYNKRALMCYLEIESERAGREGSNYCVIMADADHFKQINDEYGHSTGDLVLRKIAECLSNCIRPYDAFSRQGEKSEGVYRYGGEEFTVVLPDTTIDQAAAVAERLRKSIEELKIGVPVTMSFGVASCDNQPEDIVERADKALYEAKNTGRNRVCRYSDCNVDTNSNKERVE